jgi:WD40 repeat protein
LQGTPWAHAKGGIKNIRGTPAGCLAWHPDRQLLAIAWQDGAVSLWDAAKCHLKEDSKTHRQPINQLLWHPGGKQFMTADVQGKVRSRAGKHADFAGKHMSLLLHADWVSRYVLKRLFRLRLAGTTVSC